MTFSLLAEQLVFVLVLIYFLFLFNLRDALLDKLISFLH